MERTDVILHRIRYLSAVRKFREEGRQLVFVDETYIYMPVILYQSVNKMGQLGCQFRSAKETDSLYLTLVERTVL